MRLTKNIKDRKTQHKSNGENVESWENWTANSENVAREIEKHFLNKGMKGGAGGGDESSQKMYFHCLVYQM